MQHLFRKDIETAIAEQYWLQQQKPTQHPENPYENLLVFLNVFEQEAFFETCQNITDDMLNALHNRLSTAELWKIERVGNLITFFVYTDEQVKTLKNSPQLAEWKKAYLGMLHPFDEFNYLHADHVHIHLDSHENFKNTFGNSMQWYYRDK